jgi:HK97 family phage prohead protease
MTMTSRKDHHITIERLGFPLETLQRLERHPGESIRIKGLASVFENPIGTSPLRTKIRRGAFDRTIRERGPRVKVLDSHDSGAPPIGIPVSMKEGPDGLEFVASLNKTQRALDWAQVLEHAKALGRVDAVEVSIGFDALGEVLEEDSDTGEMFRVVTELRLWEFSLVSMAADSMAKVSEAASLRRLLSGKDWREQAALDRERSRRELEAAERQLEAMMAPRWCGFEP